MRNFLLPAGTICKRGGIPFMLMADTQIECHTDNWPLIRDGLQPEVSYGDQQLACNQSLQDLVIPIVAQDDLIKATTNNSSFASSAVDSSSRT